MNKDKCWQCKFYSTSLSSPDKGYCNRFPPTGFFSRYTRVNPMHWCGEFVNELEIEDKYTDADFSRIQHKDE